MKHIKDIVNAINFNEEYYQNQFDENNWAEDKNILFLNPQLSGKQLYKIILPYAHLHNGIIHTAITGISGFYLDLYLGSCSLELEPSIFKGRTSPA